MTRRDFVKPAFSLRSRFVKTHALSLLGTTRLLSRSGREFQAQVSIDYLNSKPHLAEKIFGWDRKTVVLGLNEMGYSAKCCD
jgi:hypothetical protein